MIAHIGAARAAGRATLTLLSVLAEKSPLRQRETPAPIVLSASRLVVVALVVVWSIVALRDGLHGWPVTTLGVALAFALPLCRALERVAPAEALAWGKDVLLGTLGKGDAGAPPARAAAAPPSAGVANSPASLWEGPQG